MSDLNVQENFCDECDVKDFVVGFTDAGGSDVVHICRACLRRALRAIDTYDEANGRAPPNASSSSIGKT